MSIKPKLLATGIGSMPFEDASHAVDMSLSNFSQAPYWPQLPRLGLTEQMNVQYTEGMPCAVVDKDQNRIYFDTSGDYSDTLAQFYEKYLTAMDPDSGNGDCSAMAVSPDYSKGIYAFEERLKGAGKKLPIVKVQTTGPCSLTLSVTDEKKQFIYYNNELREMAVKALAMKCRWQIQKFAPYAEKVICFIDEPILSAYGTSTYVAVSRESVVRMLAEVTEAVAADGAISGVHCCGNTEWSIPIDAGAGIVSFDAFGFGETIARYPDDVKTHLQKGRMLAWGVVPTSPAIREHDTESLTAHLEKMIDTLAAKGIDKQLIIEQALVTPSCGTGAMEPADAEKVFKLTDAVSKAMREKYGF